MEFATLVFLSIIVEGIVEWIKTIYQSGRFHLPTLIALLVGVIVSVSAGFDMFAMVGVPLRWPLAGEILTGIMLSRGSNYMHGLVDKICTKENEK